MPIDGPKIRSSLRPHNDAPTANDGGAQPPPAGKDHYRSADQPHGILGGLSARLGGLWRSKAVSVPSDRAKIIEKIVSLIENGQGVTDRLGVNQATKKDVKNLREALHLMLQHHIESVTVMLTHDGEAKAEEMSVADVQLDLAYTLDAIGGYNFKERVEEFILAAKMFKEKGDLYKAASALRSIPVILGNCAYCLERDKRPVEEIRQAYSKIADAELAFLKIFVLIEGDEGFNDKAFYVEELAKALGKAGRLAEAADVWGAVAGIYTQHTKEFADAVRGMSREELQKDQLGFLFAHAGDVQDKKDAGEAILKRVRIFEKLGRSEQIANEMPVIVAILIAWNHSHHAFVVKFVKEHPEHKAEALKGAALGARVKEHFGCAEIFERELAGYLVEKGELLEAVRSWRRAVYDVYHSLVHLFEMVGDRQQIQVDLTGIKKLTEDMQSYVKALLATGEGDVQTIQGKISELKAFVEKRAGISLAWIGEKTLTLAPLVNIESFMGPEETPQRTLAPQMRLIAGTVPIAGYEGDEGVEPLSAGAKAMLQTGQGNNAGAGTNAQIPLNGATGATTPIKLPVVP